MTDYVDFYMLLGIAYSASYEEIKSAYRKQVKRYHPDLNPNDVDGSAERFRLIKTAYDILNDPADRERFDRIWREHQGVDQEEAIQQPEAVSKQVSENDWKFACQYFSELEGDFLRLSKFDESLAIKWQNRIFFERNFAEASSIAAAFEESYLGSLVGSSDVLRMVARDALLVGHDELLSELATALRIFGTDATELKIAAICENCVQNSKMALSDIDFYDDVDVIRREIFLDHEIRVFRNLFCRVRGGFYSTYPYVFAAREAISSMNTGMGYSSAGGSDADSNSRRRSRR